MAEYIFRDEPPRQRASSLRTQTEEEFKAEQDQKRQEYRKRDIAERLKSRRPSWGVSNVYDGLNDDLRDAADEIEWLRASRPQDSVTRGDLVAMTAKLKEMQAAIAAMLAQIAPAPPPTADKGDEQEPPEADLGADHKPSAAERAAAFDAIARRADIERIAKKTVKSPF